MVNEVIVSGARSRLASIIAEHYTMEDSEDFESLTENYYLPQYRAMEKLLKESDAWFEHEKDIIGVFVSELGCSRKQAIAYITFYDKITQDK